MKKYLLGIRSDFSFDKGTNPLSIIKMSNSNNKLQNSEKLNSLTELYAKLAEYKISKHSELFEKCQTEIRRQYKCGLEGKEYKVDSKIKIEWDIYNIHIDLPILLSTMILVIENAENTKLKLENVSDFIDLMRDKVPNALKYIGLFARQSLIKELKTLQIALETSSFDKYLTQEQSDYELIVSKYQTESSQDLKAKIKYESEKPTLTIDGVRKRNSTLIQLIKAYNNKTFSQSGELNCECCGNTSFITINDETYLEYHHLIPFSNYDGPDHFLNIYALCPSCHRKLHYIRLSEKQELYEQLSTNNYIRKPIVERLKDLFTTKKLRSYQLEFLMADNAITENEYNQIIMVA